MSEFKQIEDYGNPELLLNVLMLWAEDSCIEYQKAQEAILVVMEMNEKDLWIELKALEKKQCTKR
jgi:hypothetical protein